jgi:hypothetical protein
MNKKDRELFYITFVVVVAIGVAINYSSDLIFQGVLTYFAENEIVFSWWVWMITGFIFFIITIIVVYSIYQAVIKEIK